MITDDSLKKIIGAIEAKVETYGFSNNDTPWFDIRKGYPTKGIFGEKMDIPSALYVLLKPEFNVYEYPVFLTEKDIVHIKKDSSIGHEPSVLEGERPFFIPKGKFMVETEGKKMRDIPDKFYTEWTPEKIKKSKVTFIPDIPEKLYNIDQTNLKETRPDLYAELTAQSEKAKMTEHNSRDLDMKPTYDTVLDSIVSGDLWDSKIEINPEAEYSYYDLCNSKIVMPSVESYNSAETYYGDLLHNMFHSEKTHLMFDDNPKEFAKTNFQRENLSADLSSALLGLKYGIPKYADKTCRSLTYKEIEKLADKDYISNLMAEIYKINTYIDTIIRSQTSKIERAMNQRPTNEQLRSMGRLLVKFAELSEYGIEKYLDEPDEYETKSIKYLDIDKKFSRIDKLYGEYWSKEYLQGYDISDPHQLNEARLNFYQRLYATKENLKEALRSLEVSYGKEAIEQLNKYDRRVLHDVVTLPYSVVQYINTGTMNRNYSEKDMNIINDYVKSFQDKPIEARIIPNGGRSFARLPLEAEKDIETSLCDVEIFSLPESLTQDKQSSKSEKNNQEESNSQPVQETEDQEEERPHRGFHR